MLTAVAVSGGADSLLALLLLAEAGRETVALHARLCPRRNQAQTEEALEALCRRLGLPLVVADLTGDFERLVMQPFVTAYASGLTPNPCAHCNRAIKFGALAEAAARLGATALATGHYARIETGPDGPALFRGADPGRDQSYFLSLVPAERLSRAVFPLAGLRKAAVKAELARRGHIPPEPEESREVCFIPGDYRDFLRQRGVDLPGPGPVILSDGREIGRHQGLWRHTVGQRKGLGLSHAEPLYVLDKRSSDNALVVGTRAELETSALAASGLNLLAPPGEWPETVLLQTCYRQKARPATVRLDGDSLTAVAGSPLPRPTPGQVLALYALDGRVLAGGLID